MPVVKEYESLLDEIRNLSSEEDDEDEGSEESEDDGLIDIGDVFSVNENVKREFV